MHACSDTDDPAHLPHSAGREEYVLNEVGKIYGGSHNSVQGRPWIFGQLRDAVLPAACHMLDSARGLRDAERGDPVRVARAISAIVNSVDDDGVLLGRWDGVYADGTKPFEWTGSVPILEERMQTGRPVKYGQCWVFAGVVTTGEAPAALVQSTVCGRKKFASITSQTSPKRIHLGALD